MPRPQRKSALLGGGCLVQGLAFTLALVGLALLVGAPVVGLFLGIPLLIASLSLFFVGSRMARKWVCPTCRNPIAAKDVKLCPACRTAFD